MSTVGHVAPRAFSIDSGHVSSSSAQNQSTFGHISFSADSQTAEGSSPQGDLRAKINEAQYKVPTMSGGTSDELKTHMRRLDVLERAVSEE